VEREDDRDRPDDPRPPTQISAVAARGVVFPKEPVCTFVARDRRPGTDSRCWAADNRGGKIILIFGTNHGDPMPSSTWDGSTTGCVRTCAGPSLGSATEKN